MNKQCPLKIAELSLFDRDAWSLLYDFTVIADMAEVSDDYYYFCVYPSQMYVVVFLAFGARFDAWRAGALCGESNDQRL